MSKFNNLRKNFKVGEVSPKALEAKDLEGFESACERMSNVIPFATGGWSRCPGLRKFVSLETTVAPGLIKFHMSKNEQYVVALDMTKGSGKFIRIWNTDGTEADVAENPYFLWVGVIFSALPADEDPRRFIFSQIYSGMLVTHLSGRVMPFVIQRTDLNVFTVSSAIFDNPYNSSNINRILKLPYKDRNITAMTMTPSVTTGSGTLTSSAAFFNEGHVGAIIKLTHSGVTGAANITAYVSPTVVNITLLKNTTASATTAWEESAWSDYRGWPRTVVFFQQSAFWGGSADQPDTIWKSLTGNIFHMMARRFDQDVTSGADTSGLNYFISADVPDTSKGAIASGQIVLPTDPAALTIASDVVNGISWMAVSRLLNVGTLGSEYVCGAGQGLFGALNPSIDHQTDWGGAPSKVAKIGNEVIYIGEDSETVRNFKYSENNGSNISKDLTYLADHMHKAYGSTYHERGFVDCTVQKSRSAVWYINNNHALVGLVYNPDSGVIAWYTRPVSGLNVKLWGICAAAGPDGGTDDLYVSVEREINGDRVFTIERIPKDFDAPNLCPTLEDAGTKDWEVPCYVDGAVFESFAVPKSVISGLSHLEGQDVLVTKNGRTHGTFLVQNGQVDLGKPFNAGTRFVAGLKTAFYVDTIGIEAGGDWGSSEGAVKRPDRAVVKLYRTYGLKIGEPNKTVDPVKPEGHNYDDVFTGDARINLNHSPGRVQRLRFTGDGPYPATVLSVSTRGVTYD